MSKWGQQRSIEGATFVPHVDTKPFEDARPSDLVDAILMVDAGPNQDRAGEAKAKATVMHVGYTYSDWLALPR